MGYKAIAYAVCGVEISFKELRDNPALFFGTAPEDFDIEKMKTYVNYGLNDFDPFDTFIPSEANLAGEGSILLGIGRQVDKGPWTVHQIELTRALLKDFLQKHNLWDDTTFGVYPFLYESY
jgi:hypothetical protein